MFRGIEPVTVEEGPWEALFGDLRYTPASRIRISLRVIP